MCDDNGVGDNDTGIHKHGVFLSQKFGFCLTVVYMIFLVDQMKLEEHSFFWFMIPSVNHI